MQCDFDFCRTYISLVSLFHEFFIVPDFDNSDGCFFRIIAVCDSPLISGIACCVVVIQRVVFCDFSAFLCQLDDPVSDFVAVFICRKRCELAACCPFIGLHVTSQCDCLAFNLCVCSVDCLIELVCNALRTYCVLVLGVIPDLLCFNIDLCRRVRYCQNTIFKFSRCLAEDQLVEPCPEVTLLIDFNFDEFLINDDCVARQVITLISNRSLCLSQCVSSFLFESDLHLAVCSCRVFLRFCQISACQFEFSASADNIACQLICLLDNQLERSDFFFRLDRCVDHFVISFARFVDEAFRNDFFNLIFDFRFHTCRVILVLRKLLKCMEPLIRICIRDILCLHRISVDFNTVCLENDNDIRSCITVNRLAVHIELAVIPCLCDRNVNCRIFVCDVGSHRIDCRIHLAVFLFVFNSNCE